MTYDPAELLRLAERLEAAALVADAKASAHLATNEMHEHATQLARADQARHFAGVARYFHGIYRKREKAVRFLPPTLFEAQAFVTSDPKLRDWSAWDVEKWWNHFETNGWKVGKGGTPMKDWKAAARNGCAYWRERTGTPLRKADAKPAETKADPKGWADFLKKHKKDYIAHYRSMPYLQKLFSESNEK